MQFLDSDRMKPRIDFMIVDESTWEKLIPHATNANFASLLEIPIAAPQHLIAMKLQACRSPQRRHDAVDWQDIVELCHLHHLDPENDATFRQLVRRHGNETLLQKLISELNERRA